MSKIFKNAQNDTIRAEEAPDDSWTEIDEAEFLAICASKQVQPDPQEVIREQIKQLEAEQLMPRATREFMLLFMETQFTPEVLALNPGYMAVKAFDNQIKDLRAQL